MVVQTGSPQREIYARAKNQVASELSAEVLLWDFDTMLAKLKVAIKEVESPNPVRYFSRHYLKMSGESYNLVRGWLCRELEMSTEDVMKVLRTLNSLYSGGKFKVVSEQTHKAHKGNVSLDTQRTTGVNRKLIDHTISLFNSLVGLSAEAGIRPADVLDGDRMQIRSALQRICDACGIAVRFPESGRRAEHVTGEDLSQIGVKSFGGAKE